jgi:hypothetical protein
MQKLPELLKDDKNPVIAMREIEAAWGLDALHQLRNRRFIDRARTYSALKRKYEALRSHFLAGEVELIRALSRRLGRMPKSR